MVSCLPDRPVMGPGRVHIVHSVHLVHGNTGDLMDEMDRMDGMDNCGRGNLWVWLSFEWCFSSFGDPILLGMMIRGFAMITLI